MGNVILRPGWRIPEKRATLEQAVLGRRRFLRGLGLAGVAVLAGSEAGCSEAAAPPPAQGSAASAPPAGANASLYPARRNPDFSPAWTLTSERSAATYNNFYEFTVDKSGVHRLSPKLVANPWAVKVGGLVEKPLTLDARELIGQMPLEERVYRFRCVEGWAMIVPWTGFPFGKLAELVRPKPAARFVRFETFLHPEWAPGQHDTRYPWPYVEGLRLDEAMNPLTLMASGIYGKPLPTQHGAPLRLVVPWKYGYKSIKSICRIDFTADQPRTFWETMAPHEYPFESNVNPAIPHPRWSQATERVIDTQERVPTLPYNGYGAWVAKLYR